jgi:ATP-dependent helicase Lhr and Lhr-like helicase
MNTPVEAFLPAVQAWFGQTFGTPTEPQALGWPPIQRGEHTLILAPTGSGKTLAAFLWGINELFRERLEREPRELVKEGRETQRKTRRMTRHKKAARGESEEQPGVRLLYISPLKALNNDVERNLQQPLTGIRRAAKEQGTPLPGLSVMVRTGDTPSTDRRYMVKHPPHILITTPESLYLILTSPVARQMFRTVRTVIVDEIHTLVGNKRGVHLALSLERVLELAEQPVQRIGLSATQRPLSEVARYLGGFELQDGQAVARPVTIVDAGMVKPMDLRVVTAVEDFTKLPGGSIWPAIIPQVLDLIEQHHTTLVFANSRRQAERAADRLNDLYLSRRAGRADGPEAMMAGGALKGIGFQGTGQVGGPFRAHHGSVSREARLQLEQALKDGRLPALVGTSSLELGIDIGAVDLVVQLQSPKGVSQGLQRVGRSGHLVGQTSVGRFFATHHEDLLEAAAIARAMSDGDVEPGYTPQNSLDVLAQQIVAIVSVQDWDAASLFGLIRRAYPYHRLTPELYHSVLDMLSGRYPSSAFRELRPRLAWDRVHNRLAALPGSRLLAIRNGGTIPDRGTFGAYLPDGRTKLGELDEEFVFETHPGDIFTLGSSTWRVLEVTDDRLIVSPAPGYLPRMPFWRGEALRRDYHLGLVYGRFRRELAQRIADATPGIHDWLQQDYHLDGDSAQTAVRYVQHQTQVLGTISSDRTVVAELFVDPLGDLRLVIHSCFGARVNSPWALALAQAFREELGAQPEVMVNDDGILFRFLEADRQPPLHLIREMGPAEMRERLLAELPHSALFGAQFRMNAARALLLPALRGAQKRTPFWLQRLRARDLLAVARDFHDFPIVAETYRDCLRDVLDLAHLEEVLHQIQRGQIEVILTETVVPSPVAASLLHNFVAQYMYEWDQPQAERQMQALMVGREMLSQLLSGESAESWLPALLRPEAVTAVDARLQHQADGYRARTPDELTTVFLALGDLSVEEVLSRSEGDGAAWVAALVAAERLAPIDFPGIRRYVLPEHIEIYRQAFFDADTPDPIVDAARRAILRRTLSTHGPLTRQYLLDRYPWPAEWLDAAITTLVEGGEVIAGSITPPVAPATPEPAPQFCDRRNLERIHRHTLSLLRKEVEPVSPYAYADFLTRWQHLHPTSRLSGPGALVRLLQQMRGVPAPGLVWERDLLPLRLAAYDSRELEALCRRGEVAWVGSGGRDPRRARVRFLFRGEGHLFLPAEPTDPDLSPAAGQVLAFLRAEGASFSADLLQGTTLSGEELQSALAELVLASLVTNDTLEALRLLLDWAWEPEAGGRQSLSSLEAELAAWRASRAPILSQPSSLSARARRPGASRRRAARQAAIRRAEQAATPHWPGRWSLVHRMGVWGRDLPYEERIALQARQLLQSYGIVTRQCLEGDDGGNWDWPALVAHYQAMEMRGEVRRGYFVQGLPGVQFALPEAVEQLREWNRPGAPGEEALVLANACDPANPFGPAWPGVEEQEHDPARFLRISANYVVLLRGRPVLLLEPASEQIRSLAIGPALSAGTLQRALALAVSHVGDSQRRLTLRQWNGEGLLGSPMAPLLEEIGFRREALLYVWDG